VSMNPEPQDFGRLRRLLVVKRHERPPPGYFHHFSSHVIARIQAGETAEDHAGILGQIPWLQWLWSAFDQKPALVGSFGIAVCSLLVWGVAFSDPSSATMEMRDFSATRLSALAQVPEHAIGLQVADRSEPERAFVPGLSSTNVGILPQSSRASLFNKLEPVHALPAAWRIPGN
jgi:hypothetical protein